MENEKIFLDCTTEIMKVSDYATKEGITVQGVYKRIDRGQVKSKKIGTSVFVIL
jgi:hypothetical protein